MEKSQARLSFLDIMISKSGTKIWMDTTKPQTQNVMSYLRKTTNGILEQIYHSLLQEEYVALLKIKMKKKKKNALKNPKNVARTKTPYVANRS